MIRKISLALIVAMVMFLGASTSALADSYTWTYSSSNLGGNPVNAAVTVTSTLNGFDVTIVNLLAGAHTGKQLITGVDLKYQSGLSSSMKSNMNNSALQSSEGVARTVFSNGTYSDAGPIETNWDLSNSYYTAGNGGLALCASSCGDFDPQGIIGDPSASTGKYTGVDSTVYGSGDKPQLAGAVSFHVYSAGVTSTTGVGSLISGANFIFGDSGTGTLVASSTGGYYSSGYGGGSTPEPASIFLLGSGLLALGRKVRAKR